jgi:hypothetical protein
MRRALVAFVALAGLSACNPLIADPVTVGGELDETAVRYSGPAPAWIELSVTGAPDHHVYALALVEDADRVGPETRSCAAGSAVTLCIDTVADVRMPNQQTVASDSGERVRLMTVWPGERIRLALVCVDETQELGCPPTLRMALHARDDDGATTGALVPA